MLKLNLSKLSTYSCNDNDVIFSSKNKQDSYLSSFPSDISDKLIRVTAKVTERYASDLLISIDTIKEKLNAKLEYNDPIDLTFWFGFRDSGVDHKEWIESTSCHEFSTRYIQLFKLEIKDTPDTTCYKSIDWKLTRMSNYVNREKYEEVAD
jgi:hypothetical protein